MSEAISSAKATGDTGMGKEQVLDLPIDSILPNPRQPRRQFRSEQLQRLAQSIASQGVIQPVVVRAHPTVDGCYELVAGERRLRAIKSLGWAHAPALVRAIADDDLLEAALVENLQREQLTPIEEAQSYQDLLNAHGYTQDSLASRVGKDRSTIANMIRLLALPNSIQNDLEEDRLTVGHARALLALTDKEAQLTIRADILARELSVRETERLVTRTRQPLTGKKTGAGAQTERDSVKFAAAKDALEQTLSTRVAIHPQPNPDKPGRIEIEYYSLEDFNRLFDLLRKG